MSLESSSSDQSSSPLPVIVGFGGYNAAGRSSFHQSYQRIIIESLPENKRVETLVGLAVMMGKVAFNHGKYYANDNELSDQAMTELDIVRLFEKDILDNTLIRRIGKQHFDVDAVRTATMVPIDKIETQSIVFELSKRKLPDTIPDTWHITAVDDRTVKVEVTGDERISLMSTYVAEVQSAGQLPEGFEPGELYASRFHPRGLQMSIIGASDALNSIGIDWKTIVREVSPDEIGVYSTSIMSQLDDNGIGGMMKARLLGERVSTKQLALGLNSMPADFINAYVLGSMGSTSSIAGACASFLYNLNAAMEDIRSGRRRVVIVGSSEAPITPEIIDGYAKMSALATDEKLAKLDGTDHTDYRRSSRPFGENCGFTIAESTQHIVLMDDALAVKLGATVHGSVSAVFVNADGYKKSISSPGPGNYLTFAQAVASARNLLGDEAVQQRSFVQAHGSSTPKNRVTESEIFDSVAKAFDIFDWPVTAVKAYVGHPLAPASGDQLINSLGVFAHGIIPGIKTIDKVADDVLQERLHIALEDIVCKEIPDIAFLNSKGFGGNNATAVILSPQQTLKMIKQRYDKKLMEEYTVKNAVVVAQANEYHQSVLRGDFCVHYRFGEGMIDNDEIKLTKKSIFVPGFGREIDLTEKNIYKDMT